MLQLPSQSPDALEAVCATRAVEPGELLRVMRTAHAKPCQRTVDGLPAGWGSLCPKSEPATRQIVAGWGRPESEIDTPVNIGNGPYRDNGEGVAPMPLPYPLEGAAHATMMGHVLCTASGALRLTSGRALAVIGTRWKAGYAASRAAFPTTS